MKKITIILIVFLVIFLCPTLYNISSAQEKTEEEEIVEKGIGFLKEEFKKVSIIWEKTFNFLKKYWQEKEIFSKLKSWFNKKEPEFKNEFQKEKEEMKEDFNKSLKNISIKEILLKPYNYLFKRTD